MVFVIKAGKNEHRHGEVWTARTAPTQENLGLCPWSEVGNLGLRIGLDAEKNGGPGQGAGTPAEGTERNRRQG